MAHPPSDRSFEELGQVTIPSGVALVIDTGLLKFWCHDRPPLMPEEAAPGDVVASANAATDFRLEGPVRETVQRGIAVEEMRDREGYRFATDCRPHSHHFLVMRQVRATPTESGSVEVGGATVCTFMTTWGDGFFPVYRDLDAGGRLVRVRIDLGNERIVERQRQLEERYPAR